jgi:hypothetical protein
MSQSTSTTVSSSSFFLAHRTQKTPAAVGGVDNEAQQGQGEEESNKTGGLHTPLFDKQAMQQIKRRW